MRFPRLCRSLVLFSATGLHAKDLIPLFPESTVVSASVRHAEKWAAFPEHPIAKAVELGGVKDLCAQLGESFTGSDDLKHFEKEAGFALGELRAKFSGEMTVALTVFELNKDDPSETPELELAGAAEYSGDEAMIAAALKALAAEPPEAAVPDGEDQDPEEEEQEEEEEEPAAVTELLKAKEDIVEHEGVKLHIHAPEKLKDAAVEALAWCVRDGVFLIATGEEPLREMIDRAAGKARGKSFADSATWNTAVMESADADFLLALDFQSLMSKAMEALKTETKDEDEKGAEPTPLAMLKLLELDAFETMVMALKVEENSLQQIVSATYSRMPSYFKAMQGSGSAAPPDFLPANLEAASWSAVPPGEVAKLFVDMLAKAGGDRSPIPIFEKATGLSYEKDILDQLGSGYFQVNRQFGEITFDDIVDAPEMNNLVNIVVPAKEGAVFGIKLKEAKAMEASLRRILKLVPVLKMDAREYMDFKLHLTEPPAPKKEAADDEEEEMEFEEPVPPQYAVTIAGDWLLVSVGRIELLESILAGIRKTPEQPYWNRPEIQKGMAMMPEGESYRMAEDLEPAARVVVIGVVSIGAMLPGFDALSEADPEEYLKGLRLPLSNFEKWYIGSGSVRALNHMVPHSAAE